MRRMTVSEAWEELGWPVRQAWPTLPVTTEISGCWSSFTVPTVSKNHSPSLLAFFACTAREGIHAVNYCKCVSQGGDYKQEDVPRIPSALWGRPTG